MIVFVKGLGIYNKGNLLKAVNTLDLAQYIINRAIKQCKPVTFSKLQKIMYLANLEHIKRFDTALISDVFYNKSYLTGMQRLLGDPVIESVYKALGYWAHNLIIVDKPTEIESTSVDLFIDKLITMDISVLGKYIHNSDAYKDSLSNDGIRVSPINHKLIKKDAKNFNLEDIK